MIAQVEPLTTTRRLSGPFDYALPAEPLEVGSVVRVPFGHQRLDGVVVGLADASELPPERLVAPSAVREDSRAARPRRARAVDGRRVLLDARARALARAPAAGQAAHARCGRAGPRRASTASG